MSSFYNASNPVETMATVILILGIVMIVAGTVLALWLRKKSLSEQQRD